MKRIITVLFAALFCLCAQTYAQNRADELMKQATTVQRNFLRHDLN